ncbi:MAG: hypothetical protein KKD17_00570 [Nanoarchaeota archaeon]|nr:hypothetical protein [Nanoarchaeota archaeon]
MRAAPFFILLLFSLAVLAGIVGCAKEAGKVAAPQVSQPAVEPVKDLPKPDLSRGVEKVDTSAYTDAQGMFIADIMNRMVDTAKGIR